MGKSNIYFIFENFKECEREGEAGVCDLKIVENVGIICLIVK